MHVAIAPGTDRKISCGAICKEKICAKSANQILQFSLELIIFIGSDSEFSSRLKIVRKLTTI